MSAAAVNARPGRLTFFLKTTRAGVLPVMAMPVLLGTALAWQQQRAFHPLLFVLALVGALAAHLGANVVNDVFDFQSGADQAASQMMVEGQPQAITTGSASLIAGQITLRQYWALTASIFAVALACGVALTLLGRPWTLAFAVGGFLLAFFYVAPPIRLAYVGRGAGEVDIVIAFGVLPLVGAFYVQTGNVTWQAVAVSVVVGLYTMMVLYFHHFLHWRADRQVGKMSPVAALGEQRGRTVGFVLQALVAASILVVSALGALPWYAAVAALTLLLPFAALRRADGTLAGYGKLMGSVVNGDLLACLIMIVAVVVLGIIK
jgi:1,4-dihydroxy-2-naphthoate octaprenyltransferase